MAYDPIAEANTYSERVSPGSTGVGREVPERPEREVRMETVPVVVDYGPNAGQIDTTNYLTSTDGRRMQISDNVLQARSGAGFVTVQTDTGPVKIDRTIYDAFVTPAVPDREDRPTTAGGTTPVSSAAPFPGGRYLTGGGGAPGTTPAAGVTPPVTAPPASQWPAYGITAKEGEFYAALASQALQGLGFGTTSQFGGGVEPTDAEIVQFARVGADAEGVMRYYQTRPDLIAKQPGLPYDLSRESYYAKRAEVQGSFGALFGEEPSQVAVKEKAAAPAAGAAPAEPEWLSEVFREKMSAQEAQRGFQDYFKRLGRAPSATDVATFRTRSTETYNRGASPAASTGEGGPVLRGLAGPRTNPR